MIYIGSDHAGFRLKAEIIKVLAKDHKVNDMGTFSEEPVDYPDIAKKVAEQVVLNKGSRGILICSSGTGMCMAANKVKGARAAVIYDTYSAVMSKHDNDANIACLRGREVPFKKQVGLVKTWLGSRYSGIARHTKRINKLNRMGL